MKEDAGTVRKDNAPENLSLLKKVVLNLLRMDTSDTVKSSLRLKRKRAAWDDELRTRFLGLRPLRCSSAEALPYLPTGYAGQASVPAPTLTFLFSFLETPNAGSGGVCAGGRAIPTAGCEDLFGFNPTTLNKFVPIQ